ncbi:cortistatin [Bombina bombina]|uniref:cortistatin n=1 Tax=Bombina bombina TaxID=8345 RepID=UPI00235A83DA|nr:cortistatin [Bombina bombina]
MCQSIFSVQLLLFLLLVFCGTGSAAPAGPEKLTARDSKMLQELSEMKKNALLTVLATLFDWTSQEEDVSVVTHEEPDQVYRQQRSMYNALPTRDKGGCKNFFWKTFSTC